MPRDVDKELIEIFCEIFHFKSKEEARLATSHTTPNWDSFNGLNLVLAVEKKFELNLSMAELNQFKSFNTVCEVVEKNING